MGDVLRVEQAEFLKVVFRVQMVLVDGFLADERVEEISALGHVRRGRRAEIAFRIGQPPTIFGGRDIEVARHQTRRPVKQRERLPVADFITENILARPDADDIHRQRRLKFRVHLGQHLIGFMHAGRGGAGADEPLLELVDDGGVDAGDPGAAEVDANPVGLAVIEGGDEAFAGGHDVGGWDCSLKQARRLSLQWAIFNQNLTTP